MITNIILGEDRRFVPQSSSFLDHLDQPVQFLRAQSADVVLGTVVFDHAVTDGAPVGRFIPVTYRQRTPLRQHR
jgi:hypothetical protein